MNVQLTSVSSISGWSMFGHSGLPSAISEGSLQSLQFLDRAAAMDDLTPDVCEEKGGAVRIRC